MELTNAIVYAPGRAAPRVVTSPAGSPRYRGTFARAANPGPMAGGELRPSTAMPANATAQRRGATGWGTEVEVAKVQVAKVQAAKVQAAKVQAAKVQAAKVQAAKVHVATVRDIRIELVSTTQDPGTTGWGPPI